MCLFVLCVFMYMPWHIWRSESNLRELVLSFQHVDSRNKLRSPGLEPGVFTILAALLLSFNKNSCVCILFRQVHTCLSIFFQLLCIVSILVHLFFLFFKKTTVIKFITRLFCCGALQLFLHIYKCPYCVCAWQSSLRTRSCPQLSL